MCGQLPHKSIDWTDEEMLHEHCHPDADGAP
jgi:hypothetical protein